MKIILSRKGFDSEYGGVPSPILPNGLLCTFPIPSSEFPRYRDVHYRGKKLSELVVALTKNRINGNAGSHLDPDLRKESVPRLHGWLPTFGQVDGSQTHLEKEGVTKGDLFLFYGWFRKTMYINGRLQYDRHAADQHVIFGWLQIGTILNPTKEIRTIPDWAAQHPHVMGANWRSENNTLYIASRQIRLSHFRKRIPGGGMFEHFSQSLLLTAEGRSRTIWRLPRWFYPVSGKPPLSYHGDLSRWKRDANGVLLRTVARGQEFVLDCDYYPEALAWLRDIF